MARQEKQQRYIRTILKGTTVVDLHDTILLL